jgi:hypothetical protein
MNWLYGQWKTAKKDEAEAQAALALAKTSKEVEAAVALKGPSGYLVPAVMKQQILEEHAQQHAQVLLVANIHQCRTVL